MHARRLADALLLAVLALALPAAATAVETLSGRRGVQAIFVAADPR